MQTSQTTDNTSLFQTKLTYGMICYNIRNNKQPKSIAFQTKLTYGMICYVHISPINVLTLLSFKLS